MSRETFADKLKNGKQGEFVYYDTDSITSMYPTVIFNIKRYTRKWYIRALHRVGYALVHLSYTLTLKERRKRFKKEINKRFSYHDNDHNIRKVRYTMSREKQIEEMAKDLKKSEHWYFNDHSVDFELDRKKTAENLYDAGYRKQSEGEWISVDERLPEEIGYYLVNSINHFGLDYPTFSYYTKEHGWVVNDVTHWIPLPHPPKIHG